MSELVQPAEISAAAARLRSVVRRTPALVSDSLSRQLGRTVIIKPEYLQRTGSFKIRGAYNFIAQLPQGIPLVAASAGNHAQGVALAASLTGHSSRIFMPRLAALPKLVATRDYGAEVVQVEGGVAECIQAAADSAAGADAVLVPPFDDRRVIAGQGTVGLELVDEAAEAEVVLVPIGGGGLIAGIAAALKANRPDIHVVGVEAAGATAMSASLAAGYPVAVEPTTIADGVALRTPGQLPFAHVRAFVDDIVQVTDEQISTAVVMLLERAKAIVEPAGALGLAALIAGVVPGRGPAAVVASGGNVDPLLLTRLIDHGLSAAGRFLVISVEVADHPGALHALTGVVATSGANLLSVEHRREGTGLPVGTASVTLTVETHDRSHQMSVMVALRAEGYTVSELG